MSLPTDLPTSESLPLFGVRVLDLIDGLGESCGRYLADLGAQVIRIEPPTGSVSRTAEPVIDGISIPFALRNAGKLGITLDLDTASGRDRLRELVSDSDILLESASPGSMAARGVGPDDLAAINPALVYVAVTGFGQTGPYRDWTAVESVLYALSGVLSRSGAPGREPLLPPAGLGEGAVGVHAAWAALLAYENRLRTGRGDFADVSALEVMVHGFDPGFGTQGSAAAGRSEDFPRSRPDAASFYPVFACADGHVRICLLAKRQWRGMFEWLGSPSEFADPRFDTIGARFKAADRLHPLIAELFANSTQSELVAEGARRGVPVGGVHTMAEMLRADHFEISGALIEADLGSGVRARIPAGLVSFDGHRAGWRSSPPSIGADDDALAPIVRPERRDGEAGPRTDAPLAGLRVLDMGVIVFGAELSRQFADHGADVIKVENANFPDGLRQTRPGAALSASVAWGHRNKRSIGLDLRDPKGLALFRDLAASADIVLANFKPGTLASMGLGYDDLVQINPNIIVAQGSAFGTTGPWSTRLGYGPLVRASCGVSALWRYPDDAELLCDGSTVYPDHIAGQVAAVAVLAAVIERRHSGRGKAIEIAQSDTALSQLGATLVTEGLKPGSIVAPGNSDPYAAPSGIFACSGDDEWCAVAVQSDAQWQALCSVLERADLKADPELANTAGRLAHREQVEEAVQQWISVHTPDEAMELLQAAGIAAGAMRRLPDLLTDPQLSDRGTYTTMSHDLLDADLPAGTQIAAFRSIVDPPLRPAPVPGQDSRQICAQLLGLGDDEIDDLVAAGILQVDQSVKTPVNR